MVAILAFFSQKSIFLIITGIHKDILLFHILRLDKFLIIIELIAGLVCTLTH